MAAPTSLSALINKLTGGASASPEVVNFFKGYKTSGTTWTQVLAGANYTSWLQDGNAGVAPTTVANPTSATAGAILGFTNATGGRSKYIVSAIVIGGDAHRVIEFYDRLQHIGSLSGTVTTAQTVGGSLTRNTTGDGNFIGVEIYTAVGATATTITASYTNQSGTSGRTTIAMPFGGSTGNAGVNRMFILPLQSGDTGVRSVQSVTLAATTGTAGNFGVIIGNPIMSMILGSSNTSGNHPLTIGMPSLPALANDACVSYYWNAASTSVSSGDINDTQGMFLMVES